MNVNERDCESMRDSLTRKLKGVELNMDVITMPDFILDHALSFDRDARFLARRILKVALSGGGEIPDVSQSLEIGGNAAITSLCLATMGARVHPIIRTDRLGLSLMQHFYQHLAIDLSHVKTDGSLMPTVILELKRAASRVNVMIGDLSNGPELAFADLESSDLDAIDNADYVCVFNWLYNKKGTELAEGVFKRCLKSSKAYTYFDPADPRPRRDELSDLVSRVLNREMLDAIGVNENEALAFARLFEAGRRPRTLEAGRMISAHTGIRVYLHTANYSSSIMEDEIIQVPSFRVQMCRGTGAGDSWNAGLLVGDSLRLPEDEKLLLANAVAASYISNRNRVHSRLGDLLSFLQSNELRPSRGKV